MEDKEFLSLCRQKNDKGFDKIKDFIDNKGLFKKIKGPNDTTPLHIAARNNNVKIVKLLLDKGMNPMVKDKTKLTKNPIIVAIETGSVEAVLTLLDSPKIKAPKTKRRYSEFSVLGLNRTRELISLNNIDKIVNKLVSKGFDINIYDNQARTLLTRGINNNNLDLVKIALKNGADINNPSRIPLRFALYQDNPNNEIIKYLLENGAEIFKDSEHGPFIALEDAHTRDNVEIFELLINDYNALDTLPKDILVDIMNHKEIEFLKFLWEIPLVHDFILANNLEEAFPDTVKDIFIF